MRIVFMEITKKSRLQMQKFNQLNRIIWYLKLIQTIIYQFLSRKSFLKLKNCCHKSILAGTHLKIYMENLFYKIQRKNKIYHNFKLKITMSLLKIL